MNNSTASCRAAIAFTSVNGAARRDAKDRAPAAVTVKQGDTRIEATCGKCGVKNRVSAAPGQLRVPFTCKECGHKQATL